MPVRESDFRKTRGPCTCGHLFCVCNIKVNHDPKCPFRLASCGGIGIACGPHGRDVCPECDACTCPDDGGRADAPVRVVVPEEDV